MGPDTLATIVAGDQCVEVVHEIYKEEELKDFLL